MGSKGTEKDNNKQRESSTKKTLAGHNLRSEELSCKRQCRAGLLSYTSSLEGSDRKAETRAKSHP